MKPNKLFGLCLLLVCSVGLIGSKAFAEENRVYIPDYSIREGIIRYLELEGETVENQLPTITQLQNLDYDDLEIGSSSGTLEGVQYMKNVKTLYSYNIVDFRPVAGMTNLNKYYAYSSINNEKTDTVLDISPFGKLKKLQSLILGYGNVQDLTVLDKLPNIENFNVHGTGEVVLPTVYVDKNTKKFIMEHPMKYSKHFTKETIEVYPSDSECNLSPYVEDGAVIIDNLDEKVTEIDLRFEATSENATTANGFYSIFPCKVLIKWY